MPLRIQTGSEPITGYRLLDRLGGGGCGEVWSAQAPDGRLVAVKIVYGDLAAAGDRAAETELQALRRVQPIRHPFLLPVERYDVIDGGLVIVTPLADGDLAGRFRDARDDGRSGIPRDELLRYLADAAQALDAIRAFELQHLDVKPQNLFLLADRCVVGDFGLVRDLRSGRPSAGATPAYSAPETFAGRITPASDQYGLAVVYMEMLIGIRPFPGTTPEQLAHQHLTVAPNLAPLPGADRSAVGRALAKKAADRFSSCQAFIAALAGDKSEDRGQRTKDSKPARLSSVLCPPSSVPAVIIGVGGAGGSVVRRLRRALAERGRPPDRWPIRLLYIDTDTEATRAAVEAGDLDPADVLPARLRRAEHYSKLRADGKTSGPVPWYDPAWLSRLAEAASSNGCRGLGRLAFADHVRALTQKIEADLAAVTRSAAGRPKVAIVAGLAGGTGSGMAIDLAYLALHLLRRFGDSPAVAGWFLLPAADAEDRTCANAFAALAELRHFAKPETTYRARCDDPPESLSTRDTPFNDIVILPLDDVGVAAAADGLFRELMSAAQVPPASPGECRTFGQTRFVWPRGAILRRAARRLAANLVERWTEADGPEIINAVRAWVAAQWAGLRLGPEALSKRLWQFAEAARGRPLEETLVAATDTLLREWGTRLARPALTLIEQPGFRLSGAEAAVRLLTEQVERTLTHAGPAADAALRKADAARSAGSDPDAAAHWRDQGLLMRQVAAVYGVLRGHLADQLAEVGLCRTRLTVVLETLRTDESDDSPEARLLLPPGCDTVAAAAGKMALAADDVRTLDAQVQRHLADTTGGLARICLTNADLARTLGPTLVDLAETQLEPRLGENEAADVFRARHPGNETLAALTAAWDSAAPALASAALEVTTVVAPAELADLARQAFGSEVALTASPDELAVLRTARLPLAALPQVSPAAKTAYQRRKAAGDSPHARLDVAFGE